MEDRANIQCTAGLQAELRNAVGSDASCPTGEDVPVEVDLMGDAALARGLEGDTIRVMSTRNGRRHFAKKKKVVQQRSAEGKMVSVRFPKYPWMNVGSEMKQVTCLLETIRQRAKGVWLRRKDFPWLVVFVAMEKAAADGEELFPRRPGAVDAAERASSLRYIVGNSAWALTWSNDGVMHHLTKTVPRRRYGRGGIVQVITSSEFFAVKERTRLELLREARERGYFADDNGMSHPETARTCLGTRRGCGRQIQHLLVPVVFRDVFIRNDMDDLFERQTPAAVRRHPQGKYLESAEIDGRHLFDGKRNQFGGIDAGLMLLRTSTKDLCRMKLQLATESVPGKVPLAAPEQDYLTRYDVESLYCLGIQWNYQLHQLAF